MPPVCKKHKRRAAQWPGGWECTAKDDSTESGWCVKRWTKDGKPAPDKAPRNKSTKVIAVNPETHPRGSAAADYAALLQEVLDTNVETRSAIKGLVSSFNRVIEESTEQRHTTKTLCHMMSIVADELKGRRMKAGDDDVFWDKIEHDLQKERRDY